MCVIHLRSKQKQSPNAVVTCMEREKTGETAGICMVINFLNSIFVFWREKNKQANLGLPCLSGNP